MAQKTNQQDVVRNKPANGAGNGLHGTQAPSPKSGPPQPKPESVQAGETKGMASSPMHNLTEPQAPVKNEQADPKPMPVDLTKNANASPAEAAVEVASEQWTQLRGGVEAGAQKLLQLAGQKGQDWSELQDVRELQRWSALVGGGILTLFGLRRSLGNLTLMGVGAGLVYYAFTGQSPLKQFIKNGNGAGQSNGGVSLLDSNRPMTVQNILIKAPLPKIYAAWADFENFPRFMRHIKSVTKTGERTSHWAMEGPFHTRLEWDAETTRLEENKRIAWSSTRGDIKTSGQVTFNALPDGHVEMTVMLRYVPPVGIAGDFFARLFDDPEGKVVEDLRNFKRYIENSETSR